MNNFNEVADIPRIQKPNSYTSKSYILIKIIDICFIN